MVDKVKFFHLRPRNDKGEVMPGGVTVAYHKTDGFPGYVYALSICNPRDNFNRKFGRAKSQGRLNSPTYRHHAAVANTDELYNHLVDTLGVPEFRANNG
jgi:hypothetical protein